MVLSGTCDLTARWPVQCFKYEPVQLNRESVYYQRQFSPMIRKSQSVLLAEENAMLRSPQDGSAPDTSMLSSEESDLLSAASVVVPNSTSPSQSSFYFTTCLC